MLFGDKLMCIAGDSAVWFREEFRLVPATRVVSIASCTQFIQLYARDVRREHSVSEIGAESS